MQTLFSVTVDTEEEWDWNGGWPTERLSLTNIRSLPDFQRICARHGASVTYFVNHAVLADAEARQTLVEIAKQPGVELGMHIHPWNTPPVDRETAVTTRETFIHNLPDEVARAKLEAVYDRFQQIGLRPTSFRGGRYSSGPVARQFLRSKGFVADSSIVPYTTWLDDGAPNYLRRNLFPVRVAPERSGETALWEIPLTFGFTRRPFAFWARIYHWVERSPLRHLRLLGIAAKLGLVRKAWLSFESDLGDHIPALLRKVRRMQVPCIDFTLHSSSLLPGGSGFVRTQADRDRLLARVDKTLGTLTALKDFRPATVSEVAHHLEKDYHARTRN